jgi:hypothetical protein
MSRAAPVTFMSLGPVVGHDPAGDRTQDLRIKRTYTFPPYGARFGFVRSGSVRRSPCIGAYSPRVRRAICHWAVTLGAR